MQRLEELEQDNEYISYAKSYYSLFEGKKYDIETDYLRLHAIHFIREDFKTCNKKSPL